MRKVRFAAVFPSGYLWRIIPPFVIIGATWGAMTFQSGPAAYPVSANRAVVAYCLSLHYLFTDGIMKKIAITFAGRKDRMANQVKYMNEFLKAGVLDEWHIWNFSRNAHDNNWLINSFSKNSECYTSASLVNYLEIVNTVKTDFRISVKAASDAHILLNLGANEQVELVFGAFENSKSILRNFTNEPYALHKHPLFSVDASLHEENNDIRLRITKGELVAVLNNATIFKYATSADCINRIAIHTGYGSSGVWQYERENSKIKLIHANSRGYDGFKNCYRYYCASEFYDAIFVKMDDDIIYCDNENIDGFIKAVTKSNELAIWSANVLNNGVCAYFQKENGYYGDNKFDFEYPRKGLWGTLWESAQLCAKLHQYFIENTSIVLQKARASTELIVLPREDRFSTNFVAFKYPIMIMMALAYELTKNNDDEHLMTVSLPALFGLKKYIVQKLIVSHLSFFKQDESLRAAEIIDQYAKQFYPSS